MCIFVNKQILNTDFSANIIPKKVKKELSPNIKSFLVLNSDSGSGPERKLKSELTLFLFFELKLPFNAIFCTFEIENSPNWI
jgi:hypothetical protein